MSAGVQGVHCGVFKISKLVPVVAVGMCETAGSESQQPEVGMLLTHKVTKAGKKQSACTAPCCSGCCRFDGPYTGKRELAGCGGGQPGIAQLPALQANLLAGDWAVAAQEDARWAASLKSPGGNGPGTRLGCPESCLQQASVVAETHEQPAGGAHGVASHCQPLAAVLDCRLSCVDAAGGVPEAVQLTLLPLQAWSAIEFGADGQPHRAEAGVLLGAEQQEHDGGSSSKEKLVSCRLYDAGTGQLQGASIGKEVVRS